MGVCICFADFVRAPADLVLKVPDGLPLAKAAVPPDCSAYSLKL
jgi:hypothetical protein